MLVEKDYFDGWMKRILIHLERIEQGRVALPENPATVLPDGERLLDNADLCKMLNVCKRTLQRYRSEGGLPYQMLFHKTYYKEKDVIDFINRNFDKFRNMKKLLATPK